jgi:hypothetical protein
MNRRGPVIIIFCALALNSCSDVASTHGRFGYNAQGFGPYGYDENYWRCGWGGACGSDYGYGHGVGAAGPPVDPQ